MNYHLRRASTRLACQQQQRSIVASSAQASTTTKTATKYPISTSLNALSSAPIYRPIGFRSVTSEATLRESFDESTTTTTTPLYRSLTLRSKHSSTQIKRLFKQNPAKRRIAQKKALENSDENYTGGVIPESTVEPLIKDTKILSNGWNVPVNTGDGEKAKEYPFRVARTNNKPNNAVGFLPVYSEFRKDGARVTTRIKKVSGDRGLFLNELRAALQIPIPKNPREDTIRVRTGGTIEIKGNRVLEVKTWLAGLGF